MRRTLAATAAVLLVPVVVSGPANAAGFGPTALTGTAYLPDGLIIAPAAVIDLSLAGVPFARGVSGLDGRFTVELPEDEELVSAALANNGQLTVTWVLSKLYRNPSSDPGVGVIVPNPAHAALYARKTGELVMTLVNEIEGRVANALDALADPGVLEFHVPAPETDAFVGEVADIAHAAGVYNDPDMVAGRDNVDDPDLIPPLFANYQAIPVTDADTYDGTPLPGLGGDLPDAFGDGSDCTRMETWLLPNGDHRHDAEYGTKYSATLKLFKCNNEGDPYKDYWFWGWAGRITNVNKTGERTLIWRWKFRTELDYYQPYFWEDGSIDTDEDRPAGNDKEADISWSASFGFASISDTFHIVQARKTHPWLDVPDDDPETERKIYHVSWISGYDNGSDGEYFKNGGAMGFVVPQGEPQSRIRYARNTMETWTCLYKWDGRKVVTRCTPHDPD
jgi:hypothetical protein